MSEDPDGSPPAEPIPGPSAAEAASAPQRGGKGMVWLAAAVLATALIAVAAVWFFWLRDEPTVTVPDLVGMTLERAETEIDDAGLALGDVSLAIAEESVATSGTVLAQTPLPGTEVDEGTSVALVIATGPPIALAEVETEAPVPTPAPAPAPAPEPEPVPEPEPTPAPAPEWQTQVFDEGVGSYVSPPFTPRADEQRLVIVISAPTGGTFRIRMRVPGSGTVVFDGSLTATPVQEKYTLPMTLEIQAYHVQIDCPANGAWSYKYQVRVP